MGRSVMPEDCMQTSDTERVGDFELLRELGRGAWGSVSTINACIEKTAKIKGVHTMFYSSGSYGGRLHTRTHAAMHSAGALDPRHD